MNCGTAWTLSDIKARRRRHDEQLSNPFEAEKEWASASKRLRRSLQFIRARCSVAFSSGMSEVERIMENRALLAALELSMLNLNNTTYSTASPDPPNGLFDDSPDSPLGSKKSQNITQCVSVPSSEHVAEIVGRQGTISVRMTLDLK